MWVNLIQSTESLSRTKKLTLPRLRRNSSCLTPWVGTPAFRLRLKHWLSLGLQSARFWTGTSIFGSPGSQAIRRRLEPHMGSPESPACQLQILGLLSLHNYISQTLVIYLRVICPSPDRSLWLRFQKVPIGWTRGSADPWSQQRE